MPAQLSALAGLRRQLTAFLRAAGLPEARVQAAILATHELAANAVQHGAPSPKGRVDIEARLTRTRVEVTVRDPGRWHGQVEPRGGNVHGLSIVLELADELRIHHDRAGTVITLAVRR